MFSCSPSSLSVLATCLHETFATWHKKQKPQLRLMGMSFYFCRYLVITQSITFCPDDGARWKATGSLKLSRFILMVTWMFVPTHPIVFHKCEPGRARRKVTQSQFGHPLWTKHICTKFHGNQIIVRQKERPRACHCHPWSHATSTVPLLLTYLLTVFISVSVQLHMVCPD